MLYIKGKLVSEETREVKTRSGKSWNERHLYIVGENGGRPTKVITSEMNTWKVGDKVEIPVYVAPWKTKDGTYPKYDFKQPKG